MNALNTNSLKFEESKHFKKMFRKIPADIQYLFFEKGKLFQKNFRHPSLRIKKMQGYKNPEIWELSLTMNFRVTFEVRENTLFFRKIGDHRILENP